MPVSGLISGQMAFSVMANLETVPQSALLLRDIPAPTVRIIGWLGDQTGNFG